MLPASLKQYTVSYNGRSKFLFVNMFYIVLNEL